MGGGGVRPASALLEWALVVTGKVWEEVPALVCVDVPDGFTKFAAVAAATAAVATLIAAASALATAAYAAIVSSLT